MVLYLLGIASGVVLLECGSGWSYAASMSGQFFLVRSEDIGLWLCMVSLSSWPLSGSTVPAAKIFWRGQFSVVLIENMGL
mmetsp:Transcript_41721/g.90959  ORF Transcript_41721/g.90959 Transcript_41721/m.90959 type:complete len:80 (+) Transcript_41721:124-363(+)